MPTPEEIKKAKEANKAAQVELAKQMYGKIDPRMVNEYQNVFLKAPGGKLVLRDILRATKVFAPNLTPEDLTLRNYGVNLMSTIAGVHATPEKFESLFGMFVEALAQYERDTTPTG